MKSRCPDDSSSVELHQGNVPVNFLDEIIKRGRPLLISDQWTECRAVGRWEFEYLIHHAGDHSVNVEHYPDGRRDRACTYEPIKLGDYLQLLREDASARKQYYLAEYPTERVVPELLAEFCAPSFFGKLHNLRQLLFVGFDSVTTAHYHRSRTQAVLGQITGCKTVVLYPAGDLKHLQMNPWYSLRPNHSQLPLGEMDYAEVMAKWPAGSRCSPLQCTVHPGQLLFIPDHWVHYVVSEGESVSVTWFWDSLGGTGFAPGIRRDAWAGRAKSTMQTVAGLAAMCRLQKPLIDLASRLGIVHPEERLQVNDYLDRFGTTLPAAQLRGVPRSE